MELPPGDPPRQLSVYDLVRAREEGTSPLDDPPPPPPPEPENDDLFEAGPRAFPFRPGGPPAPAPKTPRSTYEESIPLPRSEPGLPPQEYVSSLNPSQDVIPIKAMLVGGAAAGAGMLLWAALIMVMRVEASFVAVLLGAGIGYGANYFGGRGTRMGLVCAAMAFCAIFFGRFLGVIWSGGGEASQNFSVPVNRDEEFAIQTMRETSATLARANGGGPGLAEDYAKVTSHEEMLAFMIAHEFTSARKPDKITEGEIEYFRENVAPSLIEEASAAREEIAPKVTAARMNPLGVYWDNFGPYDLAFFVFGMGLAFYFGGKRDAES